MFDFGTLPEPEDGYYFTTEFIDGKPLDQLTKTWSPDQLRTVLVSLCRALAFLHSRGLLHRDIKPENVLGRLGAQGAFSILKLVDFGLAGSKNGEQSETSGTIDYMAPELFNAQESSTATDLYALGILMFRLAVGRMPFEGDDPIAVAKQRCKHEAPHPLRFQPELPVGLADVIAALLQLRPEDRPQSARHTIAMLNERDGSNFDYETAETRRSYISSSASVTNVKARSDLALRKEQLKTGQHPGNIVIEARAGLGRTRMLKEFCIELTLAGLKARLVTHVRELPPKSNFPDVILIPDASLIPATALAEYLAAPEAQKCWWVIAGHFADGLPKYLSDWKLLNLAQLDEEGINDFISATFPDNSFPRDFALKLLGQSLGYPSALEAALEKLVHADQLRIGLFGWELMPGRWNITVHRHVEEVIREQMQSFSDYAQAVLNCLACSPTPLPISVAHQIVGPNACDTPSALVESVIAAGWIAEVGGAIEISRECVNTVLVAQMNDEERRSIHAALYRLWSKADDAEPDLLADELLYHDFLSGAYNISPKEADQIIERALQNGRVAWTRKLLEESLTLAPESHRTAIVVGFSRLEYVEGNNAEAAKYLSEVVDSGQVPATPENLVYLARYAALREKLGHSAEAEEILNRCYPLLEQTEYEAAGSIYGTLAWLAFKRGDGDRARQYAEEGLVRIPPHSNDAGFALLLNTVATLAYYRGDTDVARTYWQRCLEVFEAIGDRKGFANMYNNLGVLAAQAGDRLRARTLWQRCADISKEIDDIHRLAGIYNNLGIDALETGALREAEDYYLKSLALFRRMESPREETEILSNLGELAYHRADYTRAMAYLSEAVKLASSFGDQESQLEPMIYLGKLLTSLESLEEAEQTLSAAQSLAQAVGTRKGEGQAWEGLAGLYSRRGEHDRALAATDRAHELLSDEADPLALLHLYLTRCQVVAESGLNDEIPKALEAARKVADTKWDPYTAARTQLTSVLYANEQLEAKEWQVALRKLAVYPELAWRFHWATARQLAATGQPKRALEEFGRGVAILKAIASRLPEMRQDVFLKAPQVVRFKNEAVELRNVLQSSR
ncbi:MAG: tetratricopeptide repeat protein [bacterium]|nr:tetratricopeptide repeat protein [bacterium]